MAGNLGLQALRKQAPQALQPGLNRVQLVGCVDGEGNLRVASDGTRMRVLRFEALASERGDTCTDGSPATEWHSVVACERLVEAAGGLSQGCTVFVQGRLRAAQLDGGHAHYASEIVASELRVLAATAARSEAAAPAPLPTEEPLSV